MANAIFRLELRRNGGTLDDLPVVCEAGDFDVDRGVDTAAANAFDVSAATLQSALEGLGTIGAGNIAVAEGKNEFHHLNLGGGTTGDFTYYAGGNSIFISAPFSASSIQAAIVVATGSGTVSVTSLGGSEYLVEFIGSLAGTAIGAVAISSDSTNGTGVVGTRLTIGGELSYWQLTFQGDLANTDINDLSVTGNVLKYKTDTLTVDASVTDGVADTPVDVSIAITRPAVAVSIATTQSANSTDTPQIDTITVGTIAAGTITIDGQTLAYDADASTLTFTDFTGSGTPASGTITLTGNDFEAHASVGVAGVIEQQTISFSATPTAGAWKIFTGGAYEATLDTTAVAGDLITLFNGVPDYSVTTITGSYATGFVVTYDDELSAPHPPPAFDDFTLSIPGNPQVATVSRDANATGGTLKVTVNSVDSNAFAYNADATAVNTALDAQGIAFTASGTAPNWTFTADANAANVTFTATEVTALRGNADIVLVEVQAGTPVGGFAFWNLYGSCANV